MFISDNESFNPALWEEQRKQRAQVAFECDEDKDEREAPPRVSLSAITSGVLTEVCIVYLYDAISGSKFWIHCLPSKHLLNQNISPMKKFENSTKLPLKGTF